MERIDRETTFFGIGAIMNTSTQPVILSSDNMKISIMLIIIVEVNGDYVNNYFYDSLRLVTLQIFII